VALIKQKKKIYSYSPAFGSYLARYGRMQDLPIRYADLGRIEAKVALTDKQGKDTHWSSVLYSNTDTAEIHEALRLTYANLKASGDERLMRHLYVERIDLCEYGNTKPFRVKIVNRFNENFDYFYVKMPDASRLLGLELEHMLSPNRINYLVSGSTIVEEHIPGIPGEVFIKMHLTAGYLDEVRVAKEFIKFNERCFVRLLGDMHFNNFVFEITPDFEDTIYRIRGIDFDQQCYEGNKKVYLPQFHKENNPILQMGFGKMKAEAVRQYQNEERAVMRYRINTQRGQMEDLLGAIAADELAPFDHVVQLREQLAQHYKRKSFLAADTMGRVLRESLQMLFNQNQA
jgi:hypothetical protein